MKWSQDKTADIRDSFSARSVKLHFTCPGLHFWEEENFGEKKTIIHNEFQTSRKNFLAGKSKLLSVCPKNLLRKKRIVLKRFFCSFFRTFSVDFLDLRQTFWQVVRTVENLSRVVLEEKIFGDIAHYLYISTRIFNKKLYFPHYFLAWLSKVHSTFLKEHVWSHSFFMNTRLSIVSFGVEQIKLSNFGRDF